jgi:hypothetical protein
MRAHKTCPCKISNVLPFGRFRGLRENGLIAVLALVVPSDLSSQAPVKSPQPELQQKSDVLLQIQQSSTRQSILGSPFPAGITTTTPEVPAQNNKSKMTTANHEGIEFWPVFRGYKLKVTDTLLIVVTFLVFLATLALWWATRRLVRDAERTAERQLCAYVDARATGVRGFGPTIPVVMTFRLTNHGQTPAHRVSHASAIGLLPHPLPPNFQFPPPIVTPSSFVLHPGAFFDAAAVAPNAFAAADIALATTPDCGVRIYLYGTVNYEDAFNKLRQTTFCVSIVPSENLTANSEGPPFHDLAINFDVSEQRNKAT